MEVDAVLPAADPTAYLPSNAGTDIATMPPHVHAPFVMDIRERVIGLLQTVASKHPMLDGTAQPFDSACHLLMGGYVEKAGPLLLELANQASDLTNATLARFSLKHSIEEAELREWEHNRM
jgi:hypothetical protein